MSCEHDCDRPPRFPGAIANRPGLNRLGYRIGDYASLRAHLLDQLVKSPALAGWTHLQPDDPGIALLEGAAMLADLLTFYQELYANETKLRTATWQESVFDLVRLTGYRPAPGLGGSARFALELKDGDPVMVAAGFAFQAMIEGADQPAIFESSESVMAWPQLSRFHLYRRRSGLAPIAPGTRALDIVRVGDADDLASRAGHGIEPGDRLLLMSGPFDPYEVLVVKETEQRLDRVTLHLDGAVRRTHPGQVSAYRLGRTFRHYGADAPRRFYQFRDDPPKTFGHDTRYDRPTAAPSGGSSYYSALAAREMPLAGEVDDLATGATLVCTGQTSLGTVRDFVYARRVERVRPRELLWANASAPVSVVELDAPLTAAASTRARPLSGRARLETQPGATGNVGAGLFARAAGSPTGPFQPVALLIELHDIRRLRLHETRGARMVLRAPPVQQAGLGDGRVNFFGTRAAADALAGRTLLLDGLTDTPEAIRVAPDQPELAALPSGPPGDRRMWPIALGTVPASGPAGFGEADPAVTVYGNIVAATQGETQAEAPIGSGDARLAYQTFALPKGPLTFLSDPSRSPPYAPELTVRVSGRSWRRVATLFGQPPDAEVYVVRADGAGGQWVQFGDGVSGARLPSGRNNVSAVWRVGSGAVGGLVDGAQVKAKGRLKPLRQVRMPGPVTGGAAAEAMAGAREAAPGRMQSLGRLVGLADYQAEALAVPGVLKAGAVFAAEARRPAITVTVLTEDPSPQAVAAVEAALLQADRCRGPRRYPLQVIAGRRRYVHLALSLGYDPDRRRADIEAAVTAALGALPVDRAGAPDAGLFAEPRRRFGQDVHISQAVAAVQAVDGVRWVQPTAFAKLVVLVAGSDTGRANDPMGDPGGASIGEPAALAVPAHPGIAARLTVRPTEILALWAGHLTLAAAAVSADEGCPE